MGTTNPIYNGQKKSNQKSYQENRLQEEVQVQDHGEGCQEGSQEEGHQEEEGQEGLQGRQEVAGLEGHQREDRRWSHQEGPQEVQERQDRFQETVLERPQKVQIRRHRQVVQGRHHGQEGH